MASILNLETATKNCSVVLALDGQVVAVREMADAGYAHAEKLHVFIEEVLQQAGIAYSDLAAIAVSQGPGSYTGLRIGVSAAKGLCFALGIPLIAIDTLRLLASAATIEDGFIVPMIDARRMEVYSAVFNAQKELQRGIEAEIISENSFADLQGPVYFTGDAQEKCKDLLKSSNFVFLENIVYPSAQHMAPLSYELFLQNQFVDVAYFEPYYLKDFIAGK